MLSNWQPCTAFSAGVVGILALKTRARLLLGSGRSLQAPSRPGEPRQGGTAALGCAAPLSRAPGLRPGQIRGRRGQRFWLPASRNQRCVAWPQAPAAASHSQGTERVSIGDRPTPENADVDRVRELHPEGPQSSCEGPGPGPESGPAAVSLLRMFAEDISPCPADAGPSSAPHALLDTPMGSLINARLAALLGACRQGTSSDSTLARAPPRAGPLQPKMW